jgi:hypothetical protein
LILKLLFIIPADYFLNPASTVRKEFLKAAIACFDGFIQPEQISEIILNG